MSEKSPSPANESAPLDDTYRVVWGPQRFRLSIGWKTLIAFALVVFVPMVGLMGITERTLRNAMENETIHSLEANLRGAWRVYYERSNAIRAALVQSAASPSVRAAIQLRDQEHLRELLNRHATLLPYVDAFLVLDNTQHVVARRSGEIGDQIFLNNLVTRAYTFMESVTSTELLPNELFARENPLKYSNLDTQVMAQVVIVPVADKGQVIGSLVGMVLMNDDRWLPNSIHDYLSIDAALFGSVIQESRIISAATRPNNIWATGLLAPKSLNEAINHGETFRGELTINEIPAFVISEPIFNSEGLPIGALSIGVKSSGIDSLIKHNARNIYLFTGLGILLSLFIAFLAHRDTMTPIRAVMGAMDSFARGNLKVRTDLRTKDEFEEMGRGFNRMAAAVQDHQERVESFNSLTSLLITSLKPRELLQKVLNKVVDLTAANMGLIYLVEQEDREPRLVPYVSHAADITDMPHLRIGEGLPGEAAAEKRVIHAKNVPDDYMITVNFGIAEALPREIVLFPVLYREEVLGVMLLAGVSPFRTGDVALLEYITNQIAVVLENALTHEQVERLSVTDSLTDAYNRRYMTERLNEEFSKAQRYEAQMSVVLIDVDHFKRVNDDFGHQVGDQALIRLTAAFKQSLRQSDILGRYGGEEFIIMLPHTSCSEASAVAEKLRQTVEQIVVSGMGDRRLSISLGVASFPEQRTESVDQLVQMADTALYEAKATGRNRVVVATG